ncbi:unnamed protein product [Caenorhabditis angaria]|uniref:Glycosyltransferase family 92 protein n=1 Tax=Caenorhabditis angaria TaxID=860376 RepID=A0A9P1IPW0_9PELO|nr:unnamed protein product [Caenorhabditis angaria]
MNNTILVTSEHKKSDLIEAFYGRPALKIQPIRAHSERHRIVTCASIINKSNPMNTTITAILKSISMGSFVNLPYEELPGEIFKYLRQFEKSGKLRLDANPLSRYPIVKSELKSELAQLNCMLMYRSTAKFLIFQDIDQIVTPLLGHQSYFAEFSKFPEFSIMQYNAFINTTHGYEIKIGSTKTYILRTPFDLNSEITPMFSDRLNKMRISLKRDETNIKTCDNSWNCDSKKCVGADVIHRSLHALYSYNLHQTKFRQFRSFDCSS